MEKYSHYYEQYAKGVVQDFEKKLDRTLDRTERNRIFNLGSMMMLEAIGMEVEG